MASTGGDCENVTGTGTAKCSVIEIKIKIMDRVFIITVEKDVYIHELKEQIASVTGVPSDKQHLLCHKRLLKDHNLLSAYNVVNGDTVCLLMRQQVASTPESSSVQPPLVGYIPPGSSDSSPPELLADVDLLPNKTPEDDGEDVRAFLVAIREGVSESLIWETAEDSGQRPGFATISIMRSGHVFKLTVNKNVPITELKEQISTLIDLPPENFQLSWFGKILDQIPTDVDQKKGYIIVQECNPIELSISQILNRISTFSSRIAQLQSACREAEFALCFSRLRADDYDVRQRRVRADREELSNLKEKKKLVITEFKDLIIQALPYRTKSEKDQ